jgi:hypothetical protein
VTTLALAAASPTFAARGIETGFVGLGRYQGSAERNVMVDMRAAGAEFVRVPITWRAIAPDKPEDPGNPGDSAYAFGSLDSLLRQLKAQGLTPILSISNAPNWALVAPDPSGWGRKPSPAKYAQFVKTVAKRYSGKYPDQTMPLPRVRWYQIWSEPNLPRFYQPQYVKGRLVSPRRYRHLVNVTAARLDDVAVVPARLKNKIVAGGLAPFHHSKRSGVGRNPGPLRFTREALKRRTDFDAWSTHPYTPGPPGYSARAPEDVTLGDLPRMRAALKDYARRFHTGRKQLWVTEFSWDSKGPDPKGVPMKRHVRWIAEAIHRMWRSGVSVLTWFRVYDEPCAWPKVRRHGKRCDDNDGTTPYGFWQSGLYACNHPSECTAYRAKRSLTAFRFPFVAYRNRARPRIALWGKTPGGDGKVRIEVRHTRGGSWRLVRRLNTNSAGIFQATLRKAWRKGVLRAVDDDARSLPFNLRRPKETWPPRCGQARCTPFAT